MVSIIRRVAAISAGPMSVSPRGRRALSLLDLSDFSAIVVLHRVGRLVAAAIWRGKAIVMAGHSRSKNGVTSFAYARPSTSCLLRVRKSWMPGTSPGMTEKFNGTDTGSAPRHRSQRPRILLDAVHREPRVQEGAAPDRAGEGHALHHDRRPEIDRRHRGSVVLQCRAQPRADRRRDPGAGRGARLRAGVPERSSEVIRTRKPDLGARAGRPRPRVLLQLGLGGGRHRARVAKEHVV